MILKRLGIYLLLVVIALVGLACSQRSSAQQSTTAVQEISSDISSARARDFAPGQLEAHYQKHGAQFGAITQEQYLQNARALLNAKPSADILQKVRPNGDILRYRESSGEFAVMTRTGRIRTYFITDGRYWLKQ